MMKPKVQKKIPLFSVITAAYRAKPFLHRYFQTLSNQTICDFEVILSIRFDSSEEKNSTSKIIHKESEILKRKSVDVRTLEDDKNLGQGAARNQAAELAKGKYLAILDVDDEWSPEKLELSLECFQKNPDIDVVFHDKVLCNINGKEKKDCWTGRPITHRLLLFEDNKISNSASVMRTSKFRELEGFDETLREREDWDFWMRAAKENMVFFHLPQILLKYHVHGSNLHLNNIERNRNYMLKIFRQHFQMRFPKKLMDRFRYFRMRSMLNRVIVSHHLRNENFLEAFEEVFFCTLWWPFGWKNYGYLTLITFSLIKRSLRKLKFI